MVNGGMTCGWWWWSLFLEMSLILEPIMAYPVVAAPLKSCKLVVGTERQRFSESCLLTVFVQFSLNSVQLYLYTAFNVGQCHKAAFDGGKENLPDMI